MNKIYLAGDMLSKGAQRQREYEAEQLRSVGRDLHVPQEDASINDKANAVQEGLAERIVSNDTKGIIESDVIVIDAHENGKGTLVELGQVKGMKDMAELIHELVADTIRSISDGKMSKPNSLYDMTSVAYAVSEKCEEIINKKVYPHNTDIRRANAAPQAGDRREYAPNQYVYGTVLDLTDGHGFYDFEDIVEDLSMDAGQKTIQEESEEFSRTIVEMSSELSRVKRERDALIDACLEAEKYGRPRSGQKYATMPIEQLEYEASLSRTYLSGIRLIHLNRGDF